jgi:hypothetical protein
VSVEAPNRALLYELGPAGFLRRARQAAARVLDAAALEHPLSLRDLGVVVALMNASPVFCANHNSKIDETGC